MVKSLRRSPAYYQLAMEGRQQLSLPEDLRYPLSQTSSRPTNQSYTTNDHLLALSASQFHSKLTPNLRLISSSNHSRLNLLAPLHSRFSGSLNLALFSLHITIIITVSLIPSHFICYTANYCSIVSENKPPSRFHSCLVGFTGTQKLLTHLRYYFLISSHM